MPEFVKAAKTGDLRVGEARTVEVGDKSIALCNADGTIYAVDNTCLHRGGPIGGGFLDGTTVTCPWHGWQYDVTTGQCATNPAARLTRYEVRIEGDDVLVAV